MKNNRNIRISRAAEITRSLVCMMHAGQGHNQRGRGPVLEDAEPGTQAAGTYSGKTGRYHYSARYRPVYLKFVFHPVLQQQTDDVLRFLR